MCGLRDVSRTQRRLSVGSLVGSMVIVNRIFKAVNPK